MVLATKISRYIFNVLLIYGYNVLFYLEGHLVGFSIVKYSQPKGLYFYRINIGICIVVLGFATYARQKHNTCALRACF